MSIVQKFLMSVVLMSAASATFAVAQQDLQDLDQGKTGYRRPAATATPAPESLTKVVEYLDTGKTVVEPICVEAEEKKCLELAGDYQTSSGLCCF